MSMTLRSYLITRALYSGADWGTNLPKEQAVSLPPQKKPRRHIILQHAGLTLSRRSLGQLIARIDTASSLDFLRRFAVKPIGDRFL